MKNNWLYLVLTPALALVSGAMMLLLAEAGLASADQEEAVCDFMFHKAEYLTLADSGEIGQTIFFNNRIKQLPEHFVPGDPRRGASNGITYNVDLGDEATNSGLSGATTESAIDSAMATWDDLQCSTIPLRKISDFGLDLGVVQFDAGFGGIPFPTADISHAGWLPASFFDLLAPGGGNSILGVTFTAIFIDPSQLPNMVPTDVDSDGKLDVAFREIYYNDNIPWGINTNLAIDVETVALHEAGHGLSQDHFGKAFLTNKNGKLHFAPRALMNAAYSGLQQSPTGSDIGGHCSIWGSWPKD